jgi:hypothetical protein
MSRTVVRLREYCLRLRIAFGNWRYDRIADKIHLLNSKQGDIASGLDLAEGKLFHIHMRNAWLKTK